MKTTVLAALLAVACTWALAEPAPRLYLTTETSAPYSMREGDRVMGIGTDMAREIMARSGIAYSIDLLPPGSAPTRPRWNAAMPASIRPPARPSASRISNGSDRSARPSGS